MATFKLEEAPVQIVAVPESTDAAGGVAKSTVP